VLTWYRENDKKPCDLPDWFFDTPEMPPFEAPAGAFFTEVVNEGTDAQGRVETVLQFSAHWVDGQLRPAHQGVFSSPVDVAMDSFWSSNEDYRQLETEWHIEYELRRRTRR
jgi:hypothetical protein